MSGSLHRIRARLHPLNRLRRHQFIRRILATADIPIWMTLPGVDRKVRVRLVRHASAFLLPGGVEPSIFSLFKAIAGEIGIRRFWDVGANIGYYTWLTRSASPASEIRMFEPDDDNAKLIRQTLSKVGANGIVLRQVAVSDRRGRLCFVRDEISGSTGGIRETLGAFWQEQWGVSGPSVIVDTVTLDSEHASGDGVDLIKIDVEGHEEAVIRGGRATIERDQPIVIFECFHGGAEITEYLYRIGYWVGDAERMSDDLRGATNFCALPARHLARLDPLKKAWATEMIRLGQAPECHRSAANVHSARPVNSGGWLPWRHSP